MLNRKALALLSGGADSALAARLVADQGIELEGVHFVTPFCTCNPCDVKSITSQLNIKLKIIPVDSGYFDIVANPKYGYGRSLNPCIDCRIYMFKKAAEYMKDSGASFIVTGEVVGQRPMSQTLRALRVIEEESGLKGLIVRPLSAKLLPVTIPEKEGILDRSKFLKIWGRGRKPQAELASELNMKLHLCPSSGCVLVQDSFAPRLKDALKHDYPGMTWADFAALRFGIHFRLPTGEKLIVSRRPAEEGFIRSYGLRGGVLLRAQPPEHGRLCLLKPPPKDGTPLTLAARIAAWYSSQRHNSKARIVAREEPNGRESILEVTPADEETIESLKL